MTSIVLDTVVNYYCYASQICSYHEKYHASYIVVNHVVSQVRSAVVMTNSIVAAVLSTLKHLFHQERVSD